MALINTYVGQKHLPADLVTAINPNYVTGPWIAGGAARCLYQDETINDVDIWVADDAQVLQLIKDFKTIGAVESFVTANAISYDFWKDDHNWKLQIIIKNKFASLQHVYDYFDFTCCQIATNGKGRFYMESDTKHDLDNRRLRLANFHEDGFLERWAKYTMYGFDMPFKELKTYLNKNELVWSLGDGRSLY